MCKETVSILHNKCLEVRKKIEAKKIWSVLNENSCRISLPDLFQSLQKKKYMYHIKTARAKIMNI